MSVLLASEVASVSLPLPVELRVQRQSCFVSGMDSVSYALPVELPVLSLVALLVKWPVSVLLASEVASVSLPLPVEL